MKKDTNRFGIGAMCSAFALAVVPAVLSAAGLPFPLVSGGKAAAVVIAADSEHSSRLAAKELADYVEKASGARPEQIVGLPPEGAPSVLIGTLEKFPGEVPAAAKKALAAVDNYEAYWSGVVGDRLVFVGKDEVAELYGVYQFLEERLDVRWFKQWMPEDDGEYIAEMKEIVVPPFEKCRAPYFIFRSLSQTGSSVGYVPVHGIAWTVRNGLQTTPFRDTLELFKPEFKDTKKGTHSLHWETMKPRLQRRKIRLGGGHMQYFPIIDADKGAHPEYLPEISGVRTNWGGRACQSNPDVQRLLAADILRRFDASDGRGTYLFGEMDGASGYCECAACRALDTPAEKAKGLNADISTRFCICSRKVADMVYAKRPDAMLINWGYSVYRNPPTGVKLDPRTGVELCIHGRCYGHPLDDPACERNPKMFKWLNDWRKCASWVRLYEYAHSSGIWYAPEETVLADDLKLYKRIGVRGWHEEMHYADSMHVPTIPKDKFDRRREYTLSHWQWIYLAGKMTWDPDLDARELLADAESKYYGAAYPAMRRYHQLRRRQWRNGPVCFAYGGYPMQDERTRTLCSFPGVKDALLKLLDEAEALAKDDPKRLYRVRQDRTWLQRYWIEPNEKMKSTANPVMRAVETLSAPSADGNISDPCWGSAKWAPAEAVPGGVDVTAVTDYRRLYFLFKVSSGMVAHEKIGVVLYPPDSDNTGKSYSFSCDLKRCAKTSRDGYNAELEVDVSSVRKLVRGEIWRVRFFRNPDGNEPDVRFPLEIGEPKLANGSFEQFKEPGKLAEWSLLGADNEVVDVPGRQHALKMAGCYYGLSGLRSFGTSPKVRRIKLSFRAWGKGTIYAGFVRYKDVRDPKNPHKYIRTMPTPHVDGGKFAVASPEPRYFESFAEIPAGEWVALSMRSDMTWDKVAKKPVHDAVYIDDVSITDVEDER